MEADAPPERSEGGAGADSATAQKKNTAKQCFFFFRRLAQITRYKLGELSLIFDIH
jgi:hypothetical protein